MKLGVLLILALHTVAPPKPLVPKTAEGIGEPHRILKAISPAETPPQQLVTQPITAPVEIEIGMKAILSDLLAIFSFGLIYPLDSENPKLRQARIERANNLDLLDEIYARQKNQVQNLLDHQGREVDPSKIMEAEQRDYDALVYEWKVDPRVMKIVEWLAANKPFHETRFSIDHRQIDEFKEKVRSSRECFERRIPRLDEVLATIDWVGVPPPYPKSPFASQIFALRLMLLDLRLSKQRATYIAYTILRRFPYRRSAIFSEPDYRATVQDTIADEYSGEDLSNSALRALDLELLLKPQEVLSDFASQVEQILFLTGKVRRDELIYFRTQR